MKPAKALRYVITTWTDASGMDHARWHQFATLNGADIHHDACGPAAIHDLAGRMLALGCDPERPVTITNERGGKVGSAVSLAVMAKQGDKKRQYLRRA